jgi:hypothetical protein
VGVPFLAAVAETVIMAVDLALQLPLLSSSADPSGWPACRGENAAAAKATYAEQEVCRMTFILTSERLSVDRVSKLHTTR